MSSILQRLTKKAGANYAIFTWNGEAMRLYRMPVEANLRAFEEAVMITRPQVTMINPEFKIEPVNTEEWARIADSVGRAFFEEPKNRWEQLVQLAQLSAYGRLVMIDCIKAADGGNIYEPEGELEEGGTREEQIHANRMQMFELVNLNADLQAELRKASDQLIPEWMKEALERNAKLTPAKKKRPNQQKKR
jgi:hypothetical protein